MVKLTDKKIKRAVKQVINKGESTEVVATIYGVSRRRIQQLVKYYRETGEYPMLDKKRRPKTHLSDEEKRIIGDAYNGSFLGARLLRFHIQKHYKRNIPHNKIHQHLLEVSNTPHRSGTIRKRTVRSSGGFRSTEDIGGGLILLMRLQSGIITVSMGHLIWNTLKLRMMPLSGK